MKTRIVSGVIGAILLILVALADVLFFNVAVSVITAMAVYEVYKVTGVCEQKKLSISGVALSFICILMAAYLKEIILPLIYVFVFTLFVMFMAANKKISFELVAKAFFGGFFVVFLFAHMITLRAVDNGKFIIWYVFIISFLTDIFAYFTGVFFGKHKLAPVLSPKKTIEGSVGGFIGAVAGTVVYSVVLAKCCGFAPNYLNAVIIAVVGSVVSQCGDLAASSIKRFYDVKDYGNIMPGHGGVMDRFDGIVFTAPVVCYLISVLPIL